MMSAIGTFLVAPTTLATGGVAALTTVLLLAVRNDLVPPAGAVAIAALVLSTWLAIEGLRRRREAAASEQLGTILESEGSEASDERARAEKSQLQQRMKEAIRTIRTSKLGQVSGRRALYELPWYMTIGNPAAGKSTAILNSGLTFPFGDEQGSLVRGVGGTRNCDWFFTTEGILLDTAGRYAVHDEDRAEWLVFLDLLRKHRPLAPINGILVTVSIGELISQASNTIALAKNLRQRVQELTERLEVSAPVYVMFSKADLIPGFAEFFEDLDWNERNRVWGATFPYEAEGRGGTDLFEQRFDELYDGLRELGVAQMSLARGERLPPGLIAFPLEFASLKPVMKSFIATLFEDNPFQFKPVFRGFYITSALQSGELQGGSTCRIEERFGLEGGSPAHTRIESNHGFFLKDLFSRVIFADRDLVRRHANRERRRLRTVVSLASMGLLGLSLAGWSWSYGNNRSLLEHVRADVEKAVLVQEGRSDLKSRMESLEILQDRIMQLDRLESRAPVSLGLGLDQGPELRSRLLDEYFRGIEDVLLKPVAGKLEDFLAAVNRNTDWSGANAAFPGPGGHAGARPYHDASPSSTEDAYNALKTYIMLGSREHVEVGHLSDQLTRFWRNWLEANRGAMPREQMMRSAERILAFHLQHSNDPAWPLVTTKLAVIDESRNTLRQVVRGMPAVERVYGEIKARASTRFPPVSVASLVGAQDSELVTGGRLVSGAFTSEAWQTYVDPAIRQAAASELRSADWVLDTRMRDDLSIAGSPDQIRKTLMSMYKKEYAEQWKAFLAGVSVAAFDDFPGAVAAMNRLGDPASSPISRILEKVHAETGWDNPTPSDSAMAGAERGVFDWFRQSVLRMSPPPMPSDTRGSTEAPVEAPGEIGAEFSGLARLLAPRDAGAPALGLYIRQLSALRTRINLVANQGDTGPGSFKLVNETLEGQGSELAESLKFVDEQMLAGMPDAQKALFRPLLVYPLLQTFAALLPGVEQELNKVWTANVHEPFQRKLAGKYPYDPAAGVEATAGEIAQIFGPGGAVAKYADSVLGPLVIRRGDYLTARTWGDLCIRLQQSFVVGFPAWVAAHGAGTGAGGGDEAAAPQTSFRILPQPALRTTEYSIEIDGQKLRYRNGVAQWVSFVWPNPTAAPGARIVATTFDGQEREIANHGGRFGLEKLINAASRTRNADGSFTLSWEQGDLSIPVMLKIVSSPDVQSGRDGLQKDGAPARLPATVAGEAPGQLASAREELR